MPTLAAPRARAGWWTVAGIAVVVAAYAALAWDRRWIADDGLIVVRCVRELLAGHGPVYSPFERAEPATSTLWMWLVAAIAWPTGADVARLAVALGGALAVGGVALALAATARLHRAAGHAGALVPIGGLIVLGVPPFWDYATSGLETGLALAWIGAAWWLLVGLRVGAARPRLTAVVLGLGPLVRPDFAIVSAALAAAAWAIARPSRRQAAGLAAIAIALPLAYEVFRAGYYGALVPLPALAKSASRALWDRGLAYLIRYARPYLLAVPAAVAVALVALDPRVRAAPGRALAAGPLAAAALLTAYLARVGGDFMHGRLMIAPTLLAALPIAVAPIRARTAPAVLALVAWVGWLGARYLPGTRRVSGDERIAYQRYTGARNPIDADAHVAARAHVQALADRAVHDGRRVIVFEAGDELPLHPAQPGPIAVAVGRLGLGGAIAPLDATVIDTFGLANPLGARITPTQPGVIGHEKILPSAWLVADFADPAVTAGVPAAELAAARHALTCGELAELLASVRAPLTLGRFWANLVGAPRRTRLVIPADPIAAEAALCAAGR